MALAYYTNGPRADRCMDLTPYPSETFFREIGVYTPEQMAELSTAIALCVYYTDEPMTEEVRSSYYEQFTYLVTRLPDSLNSQWLRVLMKEMLEYNACVDEADGRDFLLNEFCKRAFGMSIPMHSTWAVVTV